MTSSSFSRIRRIKAIIVKELWQIVRDPSSILISFVLPLILLILYGFGASLDLNHLRIALVMEDTAPDAQSFARALIDSPFFDVKVGRDRREFTHDILSGAVRGMVIIPAYFSAFRQLKDTLAPIQVIADGSEPNTANFVQNYVSGAWQAWLNQEAITQQLRGLPLIDVLPRYWYNQELASRNFLVPGSLAFIMSLIGTLLTALVVSREWERGTMEALMATPVTIFEMLLGKLVPYFILGMFSMALCTVVARVVYDLPLRGSWWVLVLVSSCFLIASLGIGLFISSIFRNQFAASQAAMVASFLPAYMLSGFIFEISSMPLPIRLFTYLVPARYFVSSLQTIFLAGDVWPLLISNMIPMLLFAVIIFAVTARMTVKRLD